MIWTFKITDMHCPACVMRIEGIGDELPGICEISASYQKGQVVVVYDESLVSEDEILAAVESLGYHVS